MICPHRLFWKAIKVFLEIVFFFIQFKFSQNWFGNIKCKSYFYPASILNSITVYFLLFADIILLPIYILCFWGASRSFPGDNFSIQCKPSINLSFAPWAWSVQPFWNLLDTNKQTNRQTIQIYMNMCMDAAYTDIHIFCFRYLKDRKYTFIVYCIFWFSIYFF